MKTLKSILIFSLIVSLVACSKKENDAVTPAAGKGMVTAMVDGQSFTSEQATSTYNKSTKALTLVGYNSIHMMGFTLENLTGPGTITLVDISKTGSTGSYIEVKTNTTYTNKEGRTGTVTVTKFDGSTLVGTFSMKTYNLQQKREVVITSGTFNVPVETI